MRTTEHKILTAVKKAMSETPISGVYMGSEEFKLNLSRAEWLWLLKRQNDLSLSISYNNEEGQ